MPSWPHAPPHLLEQAGVYMVTCGTYLKAHHFNSPERRQLLYDTLLAAAQEAGWKLHAWAVFANHYHFIANSPEDAKNLSQWIGNLHRTTAIKVNSLDNTPGRKVWHQFRDSHITYSTSYFSRLHYVHKNAVKHGIVLEASQYPWCSAAAFELNAPQSLVKSVYSFKLDQVKVFDEF